MIDTEREELRRELRDRPLDELLRDLLDQTGTLVRQEVALAKAEMREKAAAAGRGGAMLGGATVVGLMAVGALTACLIAVLALVLPVWLAALIVAALLGLAAWALGSRGVDVVRRAMPPVPEETADQVKEDVAWLRTHTRSEQR